jgi:hypothetical protein
MGGMSFGAKWWTRATAAVTGAALSIMIPAYAWAASNGVADVAIEAAKVRRRSGGGFFGVIGILCCLLVVGGIVLAIFLIMRNRKKPRP